MDKRFVIVLVVLLVLFGGFLVFNKKSSAPAGTTAGAVSSHVEGDASLSVEVVEYGDFQCPVCGQFYPITKAVKEKYAGRVRFVFKNFPLDSIHKNARAAHRAAEAASLQGKFFEMHDLLYENQNSWNTLNDPLRQFDEYAKQLGLDVSKFDTDYAREAVNATINADTTEGQAKKVSGTPTFFLNGQPVQNSEVGSLELFSAKLDALLSSAPTPTPTSTPTPTVTPSPEVTE